MEDANQADDGVLPARFAEISIDASQVNAPIKEVGMPPWPISCALLVAGDLLIAECLERVFRTAQ